MWFDILKILVPVSSTGVTTESFTRTRPPKDDPPSRRCRDAMKELLNTKMTPFKTRQGGNIVGAEIVSVSFGNDTMNAIDRIPEEILCQHIKDMHKQVLPFDDDLDISDGRIIKYQFPLRIPGKSSKLDFSWFEMVQQIAPSGSGLPSVMIRFGLVIDWQKNMLDRFQGFRPRSPTDIIGYLHVESTGNWKSRDIYSLADEAVWSIRELYETAYNKIGS